MARLLLLIDVLILVDQGKSIAWHRLRFDCIVTCCVKDFYFINYFTLLVILIEYVMWVMFG